MTKALHLPLIERDPILRHEYLHVARTELELLRDWGSLFARASRGQGRGDQYDKGHASQNHFENSMLASIASNTASDSSRPMNVQMNMCEWWTK